MVGYLRPDEEGEGPVYPDRLAASPDEALGHMRDLGYGPDRVVADDIVRHPDEKFGEVWWVKIRE